MKLIVAFWLIAAATAAPPLIIISDDKASETGLPIYESKMDADGNYSFSYSLPDGQMRKEQGQVKNAGLENQSMVVTGSYHWVGPDGVKYEVIYTADENGYQPEIPTEDKVVQVSVTPQIASMLG